MISDIQKMSRLSCQILDKKIDQGEQFYQLQMLGHPRANALWHSKSSIQNQYPSFIPSIQRYDIELAQRCHRLKGHLISKKENKLIDPKESLEFERQPRDRRRQGKPKLRLRERHQIFQQAKEQIREKTGNYTVPSAQFVLYIKTPQKLENNWVFGDRIKRIVTKKKGASDYQVEWNDGSRTTVRQEQLLAKEVEKFCQFWQNRLNLYKCQTRNVQ